MNGKSKETLKQPKTTILTTLLWSEALIINVSTKTMEDKDYLYTKRKHSW